MHVLQRLAWYWRVEALNTAIIPGSSATILLSLGGHVSLGFVFANLSIAFILAAGAGCWRAAARRRTDGREVYLRRMRMLARCKRIALALLLVTFAILAWECIARRDAALTRWASWICLLIAVVEYVNYYVVQPQHFDNKADLVRLLRGKALRRAHLARNLDALRTRRS